MAEVINVIIVFGTRPEAIKLAPLIRQMQKDPRFKCTIISTNQQKDMVIDVLRFFNIGVDISFETMHPGQSLNALLVNVTSAMDNWISKLKPNYVIVQGDTTTAISSAIAAFNLQVPVVHVEAGLRSYDAKNPFPEEINRLLIDSLSDLLFAPSMDSFSKLTELRHDQKAYFTGNTGIDALKIALEIIEYESKNETITETSSYDALSKYVLITQHRRENLNVNIYEVLKAALNIAESGVPVIFMEHFNPGVKRAIDKFRHSNSNLIFMKPLPYGSFIRLLSRASLVITDSGGLQEEVPYLGIPMIVTRKVTERREIIDNVQSVVVATESETITRKALEMIRHEAKENPCDDNYVYGDGRASEKICEMIFSDFQEHIKTIGDTQ